MYTSELKPYVFFLDALFRNVSKHALKVLFPHGKPWKMQWDGSVMLKYIRSNLGDAGGHRGPFDQHLRKCRPKPTSLSTLANMSEQGIDISENAKTAFFAKADFIGKPHKLFLAEYVRFCYQPGHFVPLVFKDYPDEVDELRGYYPGDETEPAETEVLTRPGIFREFLDRFAPHLHDRLTVWGVFSTPDELKTLRTYLRQRAGELDQELRNRYLPLAARDLHRALPPLIGRSKADGPIPRVIRQVLDVAEGGDASSPQIAAIHHASRKVRNVVRVLLHSIHPLVLLGDPGTGKTWTLKEAELELAMSERRRVFPKITVFVRLGEFLVTTGQVDADDVAAYVRRSVPSSLRPFLEDLGETNRLVILFDGMDEMSRERYAEHTKALSHFALGQEKTRTLFSCRITDFSSEFIHRKLVLLPFSEAQVRQFLRRYGGEGFELNIEGQTWNRRQLAKKLMQEELAVNPRNPFQLWLLCLYLWEQNEWPTNRVELLEFYCEHVFRSKAIEESDNATRDNAFQAWGEIAFRITHRDLGTAVSLGVLDHSWQSTLPLGEAIRAGSVCGFLEERTIRKEQSVTFAHKRLQEFFAARHIHLERPALNWLEMLDAPRWWQTIINAVIFGGSREAIAQLEGSILETVEALDASQSAIDPPSERIAETEERSLDTREEVRLADRVEFAAELVRKTSGVVEETCDQLARTAYRGMKHLMEIGNPISQVKMIHACRHLPLDREKIMANTLESKIGWVRHQALTVLAADPGKTSLVKTLAYDLACHRVLPNLGAYFSATRKAGRNDQSMFVLLVGILYLLVLAFPLVLGMAVNDLRVIQLFGPEFAEAVANWIPWLGGVLTLLALLAFWAEGPLAVLLISLLGPGALTIVVGASFALSNTSLADLGGALFGMAIICALFILHFVALVMIWHGFCVAVLLVVARIAGKPIENQRVLFRTLWERTYRPALNEESLPFMLVGPFLLGVIWLIVAIAGWLDANPQIVAAVGEFLRSAVQVVVEYPRQAIAILAALIAYQAIVNLNSIVSWFGLQAKQMRNWWSRHQWVSKLIVLTAFALILSWLDRVSRAATLGTLFAGLSVAVLKRKKIKAWVERERGFAVWVFAILFLYAVKVWPPIVGAVLAGGVAWNLRGEEHRQKWIHRFGTGVRLAALVLFLGVTVWIVALLWGIVAPLVESLIPYFGAAGRYFDWSIALFDSWISSPVKDAWTTVSGPALLTAISVTVGALLFGSVLFLIRRVRRGAMSAKLVPTTFVVPKGLNAQDWNLHIRALCDDPGRQHLFLQVDRQALDLSIEQYLAHLEELEDSISHEPALSTYWRRRSDTLESVRQQRSG